MYLKNVILQHLYRRMEKSGPTSISLLPGYTMRQHARNKLRQGFVFPIELDIEMQLFGFPIFEIEYFFLHFTRDTNLSTGYITVWPWNIRY